MSLVTNTGYIFIELLCLGLILIYARKINGGWALTTFFLVLVALVVINVVGLAFILFGARKSLEYQDVVANSFYKVFAISLTSVFTFLLGGHLFKSLFEKIHPSVKAWGEYFYEEGAAYRVILWAGVVCLIGFAAYLWPFKDFALFKFIETGFKNPVQIRSEFSGVAVPWYLQIFFKNFLMFLAWFFLLKSLRPFKWRSQWVYAFLFVGACALYSFLKLHKAPFLTFFLYSVVVLIRYGTIKISKWNLSVGGLGFIALLVVSNKIFSGLDVGFFESIYIGFNRLVTGQIYSAILCVDLFPSKIMYFWGQGFANPGGIFPYEPINFTQMAWEYYYSHLSEQNLSGNMPAFFAIEWYVNFGWSGVIFGSLLTGALIFTLSYFVEAIRVDEIKFPLAAVIAVTVTKLATTGFSDIFYNFQLYFFLVFFVLLLLNYKKIFSLLGQRKP